MDEHNHYETAEIYELKTYSERKVPCASVLFLPAEACSGARICERIFFRGPHLRKNFSAFKSLVKEPALRRYYSNSTKIESWPHSRWIFLHPCLNGLERWLGEFQADQTKA